ncbi:MAG: DNA repair protein RecO [Magnetococcales bacterium]|nr:DNA repair protein RecO [Magnetococcales bacterium]
MVESDRGVVLRRIPHGETSLLITFLGSHSGRLNCLARGVRRGGRGGRAALAGLHTLSFGYQRRDALALATLREVEVVRSRSFVTAFRPGGHLAAMLLCEAGYRHALPGGEQEGLFLWLEEGLDHLDRGEEPLWVLGLAWGRLARLLGFGWALHLCHDCGGEEDLQHFSLHRGKAYCRACAARPENRAVAVGERLLRTMRHLPSAGVSSGLSGEEKELFYRLGTAYLAFHGEHTLRWDREFRQVMGIPPPSVMSRRGPDGLSANRVWHEERVR